MEHRVYREGLEHAIANDEVIRYRASQTLNRWAKQTLLPRQYTPDGRSSQDVDMGVFQYAVGTHPAVLDGFVSVTRKIIAEQEHGNTREKKVGRSDR